MKTVGKDEQNVIVPEVVYSGVTPNRGAAGRRLPDRPRFWLPVALFVFTCASTLVVGGLAYAVSLMTILVCHEAGHFLQAKRYNVPASLPYFIPMPFTPIGTFGAVIAMRGRMGDRRSLFDIGITGPLAGLVPTLVFCVVGLYLSKVGKVDGSGGLMLGEPLVFKAIGKLIFGTLPEGRDIILHPMAFAAWVGLLITSLNLLPIGQLDGGHVLYALMRDKAASIATLVLGAAVVAVVLLGYYWWTLMLILLMFMGPYHPPTSCDDMELGTVRTILGWSTLAFIFIGFTPTPLAT